MEHLKTGKFYPATIDQQLNTIYANEVSLLVWRDPCPKNTIQKNLKSWQISNWKNYRAAPLAVEVKPILQAVCTEEVRNRRAWQLISKYEPLLRQYQAWGLN
ncbi:hypothetical protein B1207_07490 [Legionella quinlivanii]|uniref:Uncharacterized protein n=1 Tax=Legionella quinlivanii TaxID=45073 RepID=A0A364LJH9_9GAMM|nr:hypothetical protein [Legionella quinlivanii]RAP36639.1 hypothetical protein B1207_07490 [Legionella quinlivanii]